MVADPTKSAVVVVDMQNDFLTEGGAFPRRHVEAAQLTAAIGWLVAAARQQGRRVVWVTSAYGEVADAAKGETHVGAPCCARGSWGARMVDALVDVQRAEDILIIKGWYSAFRDTELHARLTAAGVTTVVLCGVATNVCVLATAREARRLGYAVEVLADATAAGTSNKHLGALADVEKLGARRRSWGDLLAEAPVQLTGLGAGGTTLWCGALGEAIGEETFDEVQREVDWQVMFHRGGEVPRRVAIQGLRADGAEPLYRHPVDEQPVMVDFTPRVEAIRRAVERRVGHRLNHCLLQLYRDGRDWIGEHADKTLDMVRPSKIINVSLGRTRAMILRAKKDAEVREVQRIPLPHASFLAMDLGTNRAMFHAIRQEVVDRGDGPRISLTFRDIGTFWEPASGAVWGVGATAATREEAAEEAAARALRTPEARRQLERAQAERLLQLFRDENQDPGFDAEAYRPGFAVPNLRSMLEVS